ncbi:UNKNOWN [Stylonychia lemnae]|uniref:Uncharacterized protein n=1 Tax=Stylonychia lemnae TaxID=5949 RepID=A0A078AW53_STYLE|nr:UNKNOWN [Stylonychia lemnae]|eukprot:CDW85023.1 UNKNOWN [Stylonychia lemnae]
MTNATHENAIQTGIFPPTITLKVMKNSQITLSFYIISIFRVKLIKMFQDLNCHSKTVTQLFGHRCNYSTSYNDDQINKYIGSVGSERVSFKDNKMTNALANTQTATENFANISSLYSHVIGIIITKQQMTWLEQQNQEKICWQFKGSQNP